MPIRAAPSSALRASRSLALSRTPSIRPFSAPAVEKPEGSKPHAEHHEDHYDPPTGWLWGVKPGEKAPVEGWENIWVYGFFGSLIAGAVAYAFKPDTSIQTWALEEARRRLEVEGILAEPKDKP